MPVSANPATLSIAAQLRAAFAEAGRQVGALGRSGFSRVRHPGTLPFYGWVLGAVWVLGIVGDAFTTIAMMGTGLFYEANSWAAAGMGVLGVPGYVVAASVVAVGLAVLSVGARGGLYGHVAGGVCALVGVVKLAVAVSNVLVWVG